MKRLFVLPFLLFILTACSVSAPPVPDDIHHAEYYGINECGNENGDITGYEDEQVAENNYDNGNYKEQNYDCNIGEDTGYIPQPPELTPEIVADYFARLEELWDADGGEMWGIPLHIPVMFVCDYTEFAIANRPGPNPDNFVRQYVEDFAVYIGSFRWQAPYDYVIFDDQEGVVFSWQWFFDSNYGQRPVDSRRAISGDKSGLLMITHVGFHTLQNDIMGCWGAISFGPTLRESGILFMLELNALVRTLSHTGDERLEAVHHALSIRHDRRQTFRMGAEENRIQLSEGLAVYTEANLVLNRYEIDFLIQSLPAMFMELVDKVTISTWRIAGEFGYVSGLLYGTLLDDFGVTWRPYVNRTTDLGAILMEALGITELIPIDEIDLEKYGYTEIAEKLRLRS